LDHIIPYTQGGPDVASNLVLACKRCNSAKEDRPYDEFMKETEGERKAKRKGGQMKRSDSYYLGRNQDLGCLADPCSGSPQARLLDIQIQAHRLWDQAGKPEGDDWKHWLQAEREFEELVQGW